MTAWNVDNLEEDDEETSIGRTRRYRWGAIGERSFRESIKSTSSRSPLSYHECNLKFCRQTYFFFTYCRVNVLETIKQLYRFYVNTVFKSSNVVSDSDAFIFINLMTKI